MSAKLGYSTRARVKRAAAVISSGLEGVTAIWGAVTATGHEQLGETVRSGLHSSIRHGRRALALARLTAVGLRLPIGHGRRRH